MEHSLSALDVLLGIGSLLYFKKNIFPPAVWRMCLLLLHHFLLPLKALDQLASLSVLNTGSGLH